jgi:hypothetical protein
VGTEHGRKDTDKEILNYLKKNEQTQRHAVHKKLHTDCARIEIGHPQGRNLDVTVKNVVALHRTDLR